MKTTTTRMTDTNETGWLVQVERAWGTETIPCDDKVAAKALAKRIRREQLRNTAYFFER